MDENRIFRKKNIVYGNDADRMRDNLQEMTHLRMVTYDQFQKDQFREQQLDNGFLAVDTNEFYMKHRVKANVLMIDELLDNAKTLNLTGTQKEDLNIRRNRVKDFELLNHSTKDDSKEMTRLKEEIRQYDMLLSLAPKSFKEFETFCKLAEEKCNDAISRCNDYLKRGKSLLFWKSNRNERYHMVEEAKERYIKDKDVIATLSQLTEVEKFLRPGDTMLDLMNLSGINDRLVEYDAAKRQEKEEEGIEEVPAEEQEQKKEEEYEYEEGDSFEEIPAEEQEQYQEQKKEEEYEYEEGNSFEEIPAEEQEQYQEQKKEEEYEYEEGDSFEEIPTEEQEQYQKEHQEEAERQRQAEEERQRKEAEERETLDKQAEGVNDLFAAAEQEQQKKESEEARHAEQQQQQQEQQQELYGTKVLDELKKMAKTPEMQAIEAAITNIQTEMAKEMPAVQVMQDKELEKKAERRARKGKDGVDALCVKMVRLFGALDQSVQDCLKKENGAGYGENNALKAILENLRKQTKVDRTQFKDKVVSYRSYIAGNAEEAVKNHTWFDAWRYVRSVSYDLDEKNSGLGTTTVGAGASMITLIKDTKKKQKVYFRQGENAGGWNSVELVKNFMESIKGEIQLEGDIKENLKKAFGDLIPQYLLDPIQKAFTQQDEDGLENAIGDLDDLGVSKYRGNDYKKNIDEFVQTATCPRELKDMYRNATDNVRAEIGKAFTLFARKQFQWSFSVGSAGIDPEQSLTDRNVATSRLAGLLGISSMISDSRTAVIKKDGKEVMGNVMESSRGKVIERMKGEWSYSDKAIGQVYTLQVFDMICGQIDRHHGNYHIIEKNGNVNSIKAIDNDMSFGKLTWEKIAVGHENISPLTESHMRAMPIAVINQILSLDEKVLQETLGDVLDSDSMKYLLNRLEGVQKRIVQYAKNPAAGLKISADGKVAEFTGEDQDDTLRMLKAVRKKRDARTLIWWNNLTEKTLDDKIAARKKELAQKNNGNNPA